MENIQSKYVVFNYYGNTLLILDNEEKVSCRPLCEDVFENATITFNENNSITLEGDCRAYGIEFHDVYPSELPYKVHPNSIEKTRFRKKDIVRAGWHRKLENVHRKIILNKYKIIEDK